MKKAAATLELPVLSLQGGSVMVYWGNFTDFAPVLFLGCTMKDNSKSTQKARDASPSFTIRKGEGGTVLALAGEWTSLTAGRVEKQLTAELSGKTGLASVDLGDVTRLDTAGALVVLSAAGRSGKALKIVTSDGDYKRLMGMAAKLPKEEPDKGGHVGAIHGFLNAFGKSIIDQLTLGTQLTSFLGEYLVTGFTVLRNPRALPFTSLVYHMQQVGVSAVPIVALLSFLIGLVIAYMGAQQLARFGAEIFVINLVEITTLRELGVLLTSIVIAGRSGSSFTAQIGAMRSNEEVDAMRTMGLSPMLRLAFPRITALVLMLPALVFLSDIMGILGGGIAVWSMMDMPPGAYLVRMQDAVQLGNFFVGLVKAPFFAMVIGIIGCYQGFQVTGSAESVGRLTTQSVVQAIFLVILLDALFALFFTGIGI